MVGREPPVQRTAGRSRRGRRVRGAARPARGRVLAPPHPPGARLRAEPWRRPSDRRGRQLHPDPRAPRRTPAADRVARAAARTATVTSTRNPGRGRTGTPPRARPTPTRARASSRATARCGRRRRERRRGAERRAAHALDRRAVAPDRGAEAVARGAGRGADPPRRAVRRPDARLHHAHVRSGAAAGPARPRPRSPRAGRAARCTASRSRSRTSTTRGASSPPRTRAIFIDRIPDDDATATAQALRGRRRAAGQAGHPRDGARGAVVRSAVAARAQPVEPRALHGRLVLGLGGGRRGRPGPGGARLGHRRIDPRPGVALRRRRPDAHVRPGEPRRASSPTRTRSTTAARWPGPSRTARSRWRPWPATTRRTRAACGGRSRGIARRSAQDLRGLRIGVLRHHWEDDIPASDDVRTAMDAALDVLRRLGAELEECRVRPLGELLRRQDHHRRERDLQRPPAEPDRPARRLRRRLSARACCPPCSSPRTTTSRPRASTAG